MKKLNLAVILLPFALSMGAAPCVLAAPAEPVTIYLAGGRSSLRPIWAAEELGLPYRVEALRGLKTTPMVAPMLRVGRGAAIAEPGAAVEYLVALYGGDRLHPARTSAAWPDYLIWTHFAQATGMSRVYRDETRLELSHAETYVPTAATGVALDDTEVNLAAVDDFLAEHPYFGGAEFSSADILMIGFYENAFFPGLEPRRYARFIDWYARVTGRPAYKRALAKAGPAAQPPRAPSQTPAVR